MPLVIDRSQRPGTADEETLCAWASTQVVFLSSEMSGLREERGALARALRGHGFDVIMFEDLGGRDDDAQTAYLDGVAQSSIYLALVSDRYGSMQASGRSATHEEYREARRRGLRIAAWVAADGSNRQGDARDFVSELHVFHTTGSWTDAESLISSVLARMREMAADADRPWVKLGDIAFRADSIEDDGKALTVTMQSRDREAVAALEALRPDSWGSPSDLSLVALDRAGRARVSEVGVRSSSAQSRQLTIRAGVQWNDGRRPSMAAGINGVSFDDQVEFGLRAGLLGEPLPERIRGLSFTVDDSDPLRELNQLGLSQHHFEGVARLLMVERLLANGDASRLEHFAIGPMQGGQRAVEVAWLESRWADQEPPRREIAGRYKPA